MLKIKNIRLIGNRVFMLAIFLIFIVSFYFINLTYSNNSIINKVVVLDKNLFQSDFPDNLINDLSMGKVDKLNLPYSISDVTLIKENIFAVQVSLRLMSNKKSYDMDEKNIKLIDNNNVYSDIDISQLSDYDLRKVLVSPSGKNFLCLFKNYKDQSFANLLYDVDKKIQNIKYDKLLAACWLPDSNRYIGIDSYLFIKDIRSGKRTNLIAMNQMFDKDSISGDKNVELTVSKDGNKVYIVYNNLCAYFSINSTVKPQLTLLSSRFISNITAISSSSIVFQGFDNGEACIYIYSFDTNKAVPIVRALGQKINGYAASNDGKMIIYSVFQNESSELHAVYIDENKAYKDQVIYKDNKFINSVKLSYDNNALTFLVTDKDISTIFKFNLKK
ncbi:hypothetical protein JHL18_11155 [Clostridium sp. YIM B02505]|uniref:Protein TolB n=1 Tax=Clostridium yunnanense TaxID=2800325 RepID=A0ABS1EPF3_9CLOT|nr:hypothetical protein [Clostridium yunnanense]MBK1811188.1 hypothetical protein [Clostridium yunnanense]